MNTRRDLVDRALDILGVIATGQEPATEDVAKADAYVDSMVADLISRDVFYVSDTDEIDLAIFQDLATCLANACMAAFGLANDPRITAMSLAAENSLMIKSQHGPTYQVLRTQYF